MTKDGLESIYRIFLSCGNISTDTRNLPEGCLYLALKGKNFNGNAFARQALDHGAAYAVVDDDAYADDPRCVVVAHGLQCLQQLARRHRDSFNIPVIGITGSNGKTTTKELLASVLPLHMKAHITRGNLNNHIGVPLTLLSMPADAAVAVIEMGANHPGDNAELCRIFNPTAGLITNIGKEHLEGFGSLDGVARANGELYDHLRQTGGTAFVNAADSTLKAMAKGLKQVVAYAVGEEADVSGKATQMNPFIQIDIAGQGQLQSALFGAYNADNVMAAVAISLYLGVPFNKIAAGIAAYVPANHRSQITERGSNTLIIDCYNANPSSMELAIRNFATINSPKQKVMLLGDMFEMGEHEATEHEFIATLAAGVNEAITWLCGKAFEQAALEHGLPWWPSAQAMLHHLAAHPLTHSLVLLKGSRGMAMEQLVEGL